MYFSPCSNKYMVVSKGTPADVIDSIPFPLFNGDSTICVYHDCCLHYRNLFQQAEL